MADRDKVLAEWIERIKKDCAELGIPYPIRGRKFMYFSSGGAWHGRCLQGTIIGIEYGHGTPLLLIPDVRNFADMELESFFRSSAESDRWTATVRYRNGKVPDDCLTGYMEFPE